MSDFILTIIFSDFTIERILNFLVDFLDATPHEICFYRIMKETNNLQHIKTIRKHNDSNKTLFLIKKSLYNRAIQEGLDLPQPNLDFRIAEFKITEKHCFNENQSGDFFIRINTSNVNQSNNSTNNQDNTSTCNQNKIITAQEIETIWNDRMKTFVQWGLLKEKDYKIKIPLACRVTGQYRGFMNIIFSDNVETKIKIYLRILLRDSSIYYNNTLYTFQVYWCNK